MAERRKPLIVDDFAIYRHHISYVEAELRLYHLNKLRLANLEADAVLATPSIEPGMPRPTGHGDPTPSRAADLSRLTLREPEYAALRGWVQRVEDVFHHLDLEQQQIVKRLYFKGGVSPEVVAQEIGMHVATLYRQRNRALLAFSLVLIGSHAAQNLKRRREDAKNMRKTGGVDRV